MLKKIFTDKCAPSKKFGDHWLSGLLFYRLVTMLEAFVLNLFHSAVDIATSFVSCIITVTETKSKSLLMQYAIQEV